ncbi:MAG: hypothetical protein ABIN58_09705 [candidate division WOR-3 bacterium]
MPAILLIVGLVIIIILALPYILRPSCTGNWYCNDWSECINGVQTRACMDSNNCTTTGNKPPTERQCAVEPPVGNQTASPGQVNQTPACVDLGSKCVRDEDCCDGYCIHGICFNSTEYCGSGRCDPGEKCSTCAYDCGECPHQRDLKQNVYTEPIKFADIENFKKNGYVVIRYFYSDACKACFDPVHIENQLRELAAGFKDLVVVNIIDALKYRKEANAYAVVGGKSYTPLIKVEWIQRNISGNSLYYGDQLDSLLADGDILVDLALVICGHSNYCDFDGIKIIRTYDPT